MPLTVGVDLPSGRRVELRAAGPADDAFLLDSAEARPAARATALLARCLPGGADTARGLTVGDREALLLHLRRLSVAEAMACVLTCPAESCGETLELALDVADLLVPVSAARVDDDVVVQMDDGRYRVSFRQPTAGDLEDAAERAAADPELGARAILERCVRRAERDGAPVDAGDLPDRVRADVAAAMAARDPQAEIRLEMRCPACGAVFAPLFDAASFLLRELDERAARSLREVHTLALHYHWSESDILAMPPRRRAQYIELLRESRAGSGR